MLSEIHITNDIGENETALNGYEKLLLSQIWKEPEESVFIIKDNLKW